MAIIPIDLAKKVSGQASFFWKDGFPFTAPCGNYEANQWNLYDMLGNVWEWCEDWFDADYYKRSPKEDPHGPGIGDFRVFRGGSWGSIADFRSSSRALEGGPTTDSA